MRGDQRRVGRRRQRLDLEDVAGHHQADELAGHEPAARLAFRGREVQRAHHAAQDLRDEELAQQLRRPLVADRGADQGEAGRLHGAVPDPQQQPDDVLAQVLAAAVQHLRQQLGRVGRCLDRRQEELVLVAEVVVDQGRVDTRRPGDATDRRPVEPALGERLPGSGEDDVPGVGVPGASSRPSSRFRRAQFVLLRRVPAARARASRAAPATTAMSTHMVVVAVADRPTSCRASTA